MPKLQIDYDEIKPIPSCFKPNESFFKDWKMIVKDGKAIGLMEVKE